MVCIGIDIGSTTSKIVVLDEGKIVYDKYTRHHTQVLESVKMLFEEAAPFIHGKEVSTAFSGSGAIGIAQMLQVPFVQEVYACVKTSRKYYPETKTIIELGGEDAKAVFLGAGLEERMNSSCAGGTGAFIDQMAAMLGVSLDELNDLSLNNRTIPQIASRCGVFAKTDVALMLAGGTDKRDIAASIFQAVANQTISGLCFGNKVRPPVLFLGAPLYYLTGLRKRFTETLKLDISQEIFPEEALIAVALGAALCAEESGLKFSFEKLRTMLDTIKPEIKTRNSLPALFANEQEFGEFCSRHKQNLIPFQPVRDYKGKAYLGIDCGSTTTKIVLIDSDCGILYTYYASNKGKLMQLVSSALESMYDICGKQIDILACAVTGYGEELIKHAFSVDFGIVETTAHFYAAKYYVPDVDFIIDIGGQDIKCFEIKDGIMSNVVLNEACSSGCGSFVETYAAVLDIPLDEFVRFALNAKNPVDLGSRCTVFMNSAVKQAQKDGCSVGDIAAGLAYSVAKNALGKVMRYAERCLLGKHIVVQGGAFLNDAVLRAFECEIGQNVARPEIAGLMGAFGAALYAKANAGISSSLLRHDDLQNYNPETEIGDCSGCGNHCSLMKYHFADGIYVSGNRCEKMKYIKQNNLPNLYAYKRKKLSSIQKEEPGGQRIGIPLALGDFELAPFWKSVFDSLGFSVIFSGISNRGTFQAGQNDIPSDTVCFPAKLMHGHIRALLDKGAEIIFCPCLIYNFDEHISDNNYNCPVVAYYPELVAKNTYDLKNIKFLYPHLNISNKKSIARELYCTLKENGYRFTYDQVRCAVQSGYTEEELWLTDIREQGRKAINWAKVNDKLILVLAGRPYHTDPEICHEIDYLANSLGLAVISEDSLVPEYKPDVSILNQWTYQARLYNAAEFVKRNKNTVLVQLISFGCGIDAITADAVKEVLKGSKALYAQIKIDEIANTGALKIRLRSIVCAWEERKKSE